MGIHPYEFSYLTSSPLWTGFLAAENSFFGDSTMYPLVINVLLGFVLAIFLIRILKNSSDNQYLVSITSIFVIVSGSIISLVFLGMEHLLHTILFLIFIFNVKVLYEDKPGLSLFSFCLLTSLLVLTRFESLFLVAATMLVLIIDKKYKHALYLFLSGIIPILAIGFYAISQGGYILPNSLMMKGEFSSKSSFYEIAKSILYHPIKKLIQVPSLLLIVVILLLGLYRRKEQLKNNALLKVIVVFLGTVFLHLLIAQVGWFYRYETYLIITGSVLSILVIKGMLTDKVKIMRGLSFALISLLVLFLGFRAVNTNSSIHIASKNIYEQHWQLSEFLNRYYEDETIAVNDIGLVSYNSSVRIHDIWGLADREILNLRINNQINGEILDSILNRKDVDIAAVYKPWFNYSTGFPADWLFAGSWEIRNNIVCGEPKVSFFAKDSLNYKKLVDNLNMFSEKLPRDVKHVVSKR